MLISCRDKYRVFLNPASVSARAYAEIKAAPARALTFARFSAGCVIRSWCLAFDTRFCGHKVARVKGLMRGGAK